MADSPSDSETNTKDVFNDSTLSDKLNIFFYSMIAIIIITMSFLFATSTNEVFSMGMLAVILIVLIIKLLGDVLTYFRKEPFQERYNFTSVFGSSTLDVYKIISYLIPSLWTPPLNIVFWAGMAIFFVCGLISKINQGVSFDKDGYWASFSLILFFGLLPLVYTFNKGFNVWWMLIIGTILPLVSLLLILAGYTRMNGKTAFKLSNKLPNLSKETLEKMKAYKGIFIVNILAVFVVIFALFFQNNAIVKILAKIVRYIGNTIASLLIYLLPVCLGVMSYFLYTSGPMFNDDKTLSEIPAIVTSAYVMLAATLIALFVNLGTISKIVAIIFAFITFVLFITAVFKDGSGYGQLMMSVIMLLIMYIVGFNETVRNAISPLLYEYNSNWLLSMFTGGIALILFFYTFDWFSSITEKISNGSKYSDSEIMSITSLVCLSVSVLGGILTGSSTSPISLRYLFVFLAFVGCILLIISNYYQNSGTTAFPFLFVGVFFAIFSLPTYLDTSLSKWLPSQAYEITKLAISLVIIVFSTTLVILGNQFNKAYAEQQTNTDLSSALTTTATVTAPVTTTPATAPAPSVRVGSRGHYFDKDSNTYEVCRSNTYNDSVNGSGICKACPVNTTTGKRVGAISSDDCKPIEFTDGTRDYGEFLNMLIKYKDYIIAPVTGTLLIGTVYMVRSFKKKNANIITIK